MTASLGAPTILVIEDGDEYLENLSRFVPGPQYLQAHSGPEALELLEKVPVDLLYLDMRFDRTARELLLGDHSKATREHNGDPQRGWKYLENNQGLFILAALREAGFASLPAILAYDFSREQKRFEHLSRIYLSLSWVPDAVTPDEIRSRINTLLPPNAGP